MARLKNIGRMRTVGSLVNNTTGATVSTGVFAEIESTSGNETQVGSGMESQVNYILRIHYRKGVTSEFSYVTSEGQTFNIKSVLDVDMKHDTLEMGAVLVNY